MGNSIRGTRVPSLRLLLPTRGYTRPAKNTVNANGRPIGIVSGAERGCQSFDGETQIIAFTSSLSPLVLSVVTHVCFWCLVYEEYTISILIIGDRSFLGIQL